MSNLSPAPTPERCASECSESAVVESFDSREAKLGDGLLIRRALPLRQRRLVGPWCFLDHFGPLEFESGKPVDVAPHPHIGLQTVTWLIDGEMLHKDSLGYESLIRPGELNLMTSGSGIAHSEETPPENSGRIHGVQLWVALPDAHRRIDPAFDHYSAVPVREHDGSVVKVFMGELAGERSPATAYSPIVGAELRVSDRARLDIPLERAFEHAVMVLEGGLVLDGRRLEPGKLHYLGTQRDRIDLCAESDTLAVLVGGAPFGEDILLWWNFVARTPAEIAEARELWQRRRHFGEVEGYEGGRLEAPELKGGLRGSG